MSTLKRLHAQARARRQGKPGFTLLELIVVLLVLGILAAIAVPTFNRVKENSAVRAAQTTLEAAARNGEAIAASDRDASDEDIAAAVESEFGDTSVLTVSVSGDTVTVTQTNGGVSASGSVEFVDGDAVITAATAGSGGGSSSSTTAAPTTTVPLTWNLNVSADLPYSWASAHTVSGVSYNSATKFLTYTSSQNCFYHKDISIGVSGGSIGGVATSNASTTQHVYDGLVIATRSDSGSFADTTPCTVTVDLAALEVAKSTTYTDSDIQNLRVTFGNGSGYIRTVYLTLS